MADLKFNMLCLIFKIKPALKREMGKELSGKIIYRMKRHYEESDKRKPCMKGILSLKGNEHWHKEMTQWPARGPAL